MECSRRAKRKALSTAGAFLLEISQLGKRRLGLGIAAPGATQRTTFQKHSGSNTRSVMQGKTFDVENKAFDVWHDCSY